MATRRERVLLELEDHYTGEMARAAAITAVLNKELKNLSGSSVTSSRDVDKMRTSLRAVGAEADATGKKFRNADGDLNQFTGRLGVMVRAAAALGPALIPIGGAAIPAIAALTAGLGAAAGAAGVALLAFSGLGDAMKALDTYQLEPTTANLQKLHEEMEKIGPTGAEFVRFLDGLEPQLHSLQDAAREGLFPGVEQGIEALLTQLPQARRLIFDIADALGDVAADAGRNLSGDGFRAFFDYLETDAAPTLKAFAAATGNVIEGLANLMVGFAPLTRDFTGGLVAATAAFADWTANLSGTQGFQDFLDYLRDTGPQVAQLIGQIALSLAAIVEAAAPVGQALLPVLTGLAKVIETIASSDIGTPLFTAVAAMSALRLATQAWGRIAATTGATFVATNAKSVASILTVTSAQDRARMSATQLANAERGRTTAALAGAGRMAAVFGGLAIASSGATDSIGLTNTASLALMGTMLGPWGTAIGGAAGLTMDLASANDGLEAAIRGADDAIQSMDVAQLTAALAELDAQLASANERAANFHPFSTNLADPLETAQNNIAGFMSGLNEMITGTGKAAEAKDKEAASALEAAVANARYAEHARIAGRNAGYSASEIRGMTDAMEEQRSAALGAFDAVTRYAQALVDARNHAKTAAGGIDASSKAGRENRDVLSNLAGAWNNQSKAVTNNIGKWREARASFIQTAVAMGVPIQKARDLAARLLEIPKQRVIDIEMRGGDESIAAMRRIKAQADSVAGQYRIDFIVTQTNAYNHRAAMNAAGVGSANGGTVPKTGLPYADRHPYLLADGEEVISNRYGQADRHRSLLKAINAGRLADGGTTGGGIGPSSQLYGIDRAFLSIRELGERIGDLSARQIRGLQRDIGNLSKFELNKLGKALDIATRAAEKQAEKAGEFAAEQQEQLKALRDARRAFAQAVTQNFRSDVFGGTDLAQYAVEHGFGNGFGNEVYAFAQANGIEGGYRMEDWVQQYLDTLSASQITALQAQASVGVLQQDAQDAESFERALEQLREMGLTGGAFAELAQSGNLAQAQAYLQMGPDFVKTLMQEFKDRNESLRGLGASVGNAQFGADIREQLKETRQAVRIAERQETELREIKRASRQMERRLAAIEKDGPRRTGKAVGDAVNNAVTHGQRSGT